MNKKLFWLTLFSLPLLLTLHSCSGSRKASSSSEELKPKEVEAGLRESWQLGLEEALHIAGKQDSVSNDSAGFSLPWPQPVKDAFQVIRKAGKGGWIDSLEGHSLGVIKDLSHTAKPLLLEEIRKIKVEDPMGILFGGPTAGTDYLRKKTEPQLRAALLPLAEQATANSKANQYWNTTIKYYNKIPLVKNVDMSLSEFLTNRAIDGVFYYMGQSEKKLRKDPVYRTSKLLYKVYKRQDQPQK